MFGLAVSNSTLLGIVLVLIIIAVLLWIFRR